MKPDREKTESDWNEEWREKLEAYEAKQELFRQAQLAVSGLGKAWTMDNHTGDALKDFLAADDDMRAAADALRSVPERWEAAKLERAAKKT